MLLRWIVGQLGRGSCRTLADALALCRRAEKENDPLEFIFGDLLETFTDAETKALAALTYFTQMLEVNHIAELAGLSKTAAQTALSDLANRALVVPDEEEKCFALVPMVADFLRHKRPEVVNETSDRLERQAYALVVENGYDQHDRFHVLDAAWPTVAAALPRFIVGESERLQTVCGALARFSISPGGGMNGWPSRAMSRVAQRRRGISTMPAGGPITLALFIIFADNRPKCSPGPTAPRPTGASIPPLPSLFAKPWSLTAPWAAKT